MPQSALPQIQLHDVVYQQQDATVFNGAALPAIAAAPEAFIIFYLNQADEQNGYGTVIQLDAQTKQAAIFADLNPEYSYLFFTDEQQRLQTLLWCIEFATRTPEGLFVTQAKVYGRGIDEAELRAMTAQLQANQAQGHQLAEQVSPQPAMTTPIAPEIPIAPALPATPVVDPAYAAAPQPTYSPPPQPAMAPAEVAPPETTPAPMMQPSAPPAAQPGFAAYDYGQSAHNQPIYENAPANPSMPQPVDPWATTTPSAPLASQSPAGLPDLAAMESQAAPSQPNNQMADELRLPPLPDFNLTPQTAIATDLVTPALEVAPMSQNPAPTQAAPMVAAPQFELPPLPTPPAPMPAMPEPLMSPPAPTAQAADLPVMPAAASEGRAPVGRPPKPLVQDRLWMISADDFVWLKSISRQALEPNKEALRQKVIDQIRRNQPELIDDWRFHGAFERAFEAISLTYEMVPGLRHDLLKALLNGRVIDSLAKSLGDLPQSA